LTQKPIPENDASISTFCFSHNTLLPIQLISIKIPNNEWQEIKHMGTKQGGYHREWQEGKLVERKRSIPVMLNTTKFNFWNILTSFHPYQDEILCTVRILNSIGVGFKIIAASLNLQKWKTFFGSSEWKDEDVKNLLNYLNHNDEQLQSTFIATE
jgi:hypothetical protein